MLSNMPVPPALGNGVVNDVPATLAVYAPLVRLLLVSVDVLLVLWLLVAQRSRLER